MRNAQAHLKTILLFLALSLFLGGCRGSGSAGEDGTAWVNIFYAQPEGDTSAQNVLVIDRDSGLPLYEKNASERVYPASTTKMMTALCAVESVKNLDRTTVTVRQEVLDQLSGSNSSLAGLEAGEKLSMRELLYCLLLPSGNDAAAVIADYISGGESGFAQLMNQRAAELGCTDTCFVNPHGLAGKEQYSTAWDLARIAEAFMREPELAKIAGTSSYTFDSNVRGEVTVSTSNLLLDPDSELYEPAAQGVKTGITSLGASFVSAGEQDGLRVLCVAAGVPATNGDGYLISPNPALAEGRKFLTWALSSFVRVTLYDGGETFSVPVDGKELSAVPTAREPVTIVLPREQAAQLTARVTALTDGAADEDAVGMVTWYCGDMPVAEGLPLVPVMPLWLWLIIVALLAVLAALLVVLWVMVRQRRRAAAEAPAEPEWVKEAPPPGPEWDDWQ